MTMILKRLGNKKKVAKEIQKHFPPHKIYIEPFFGAGGMFFNKPKAKYNFLNDLDSDVFNLFQVVTNQKDELLNYLELMPFSQELFNYWMANKETDPIKKAARFLFISNMSYLGKADMMALSFNTPFQTLIKNINGCENFSRSRFTNMDFRKFLPSLSFRKGESLKTLIYNDPPYLRTTDNYSHSFTKQDLIDLIEVNIESGCKFAISEFDNPVVLELADQYNLEVITIGERQNLKNRRTEILMVNYQSPGKYGLFAGH